MAKLYQNLKGKKVDEQYQQLLQSRAWFILVFLTFVTGLFITKQLFEYETKKINDGYNKELVDPILDFITMLNAFAFLVNVALCIICYKYRNVTKALIYIENIVALLISLNVGE